MATWILRETIEFPADETPLIPLADEDSYGDTMPIYGVKPDGTKVQRGAVYRAAANGDASRE